MILLLVYIFQVIMQKITDYWKIFCKHKIPILMNYIITQEANMGFSSSDTNYEFNT